MSKVTKVFIPHTRKSVGFVDGDVFVKRVKGSIHFLRQPPAIAFDVQSLSIAKELGALYVRVMDAEVRPVRSYWQRISTILTEGFRFNRGYGEQVGVTIDKFRRSQTDLAQSIEMF